MQTALPMMALSVPIKQAVSFEASMADVAKTMDGMRDDDGNLTEQYYAMEQAVKDMARTIPMAHEELAGLFAAAGQQGLTDLGEIQEFVGMSAQMAVAFGMNQEEAADAIGGYRAALGLSFKDTRTMLDLMNQYANTTTASEKDIAEVVRRIGSLGQQAGVTVKPMTALSATLVSMKIPPEEAATGIKNFLLTMVAGRAATKAQTEEFKRLGFNAVEMAEAMQKDAPTAIMTLLKTIKKLPEAERISSLTTLFGSQALPAIAPLLGQLDLVSQNLGISADETQYAGAMQKEFESRTNTTQAKMQLFSNKLKEASINLGSALLPTLNETMDTFSPLITSVSSYVKENPALIKYTLGTAGVMLACKMAFLATRYAVNGLVTTYKIAQGAKLAFVAVTKKETYSLIAQKVAQGANTVVTLAGAGVKKAYALASMTVSGAVSLVTMLLKKNTYSLIAQKVAMLRGVTATKAVTAAQKLFNIVLGNNPIGYVIRGVSLLVGGMYALYQTCEPVQKAFDAVFSAIGSSLQWLWDKFILLYKKGRAVLEFLGLVDEEKEEIDFSMPTAQNAAQNMANSAEQKQNTKIQLDESSFGFAMQYAYMAEQEKTENKKAVPTASNIISENNKVSPTQYAVPDYDSFSETTAVTNAITNENYTSQKNYPKEQTAITIPMHFDIKAIDQAEFSKGMEKERPRIEKIVREVLEKCKHQEARVSFAN